MEGLSAAFWGFGNGLQNLVTFFGNKKIASAEESAGLVQAIFNIVDAVYALLGGAVADGGIVVGKGIAAIFSFFA